MVSRRASDMDSKYRLLEILNKEGSLEFTQNYIKCLYEEMISAIRAIDGGSPLWEETMEKFYNSLMSSKIPFK